MVLRTATSRATPPATLEPFGPVYAAPSITSTGAPIELELDVPRHPAPATHPGALSGTLRAVSDDPADERRVPLAKACGRYVDWYRVAA